GGHRWRVSRGRPRLDRRHRAWRADLRRDRLGFHLPAPRRLLPGDGEGRDHRRRGGARPVAPALSGAPRVRRKDGQMSDIILETRSLTKHYGGIRALEGANFVLRKGEHVAIMGDNGAGKSTFVRQITGVERPTRGEIIFDGNPVSFAGPLEAREA